MFFQNKYVSKSCTKFSACLFVWVPMEGGHVGFVGNWSGDQR